MRQGGDEYAMMGDITKAMDPYDNGIGVAQAIVNYFITTAPAKCSRQMLLPPHHREHGVLVS
jgi:hypothetical protein